MELALFFDARLRTCGRGIPILRREEWREVPLIAWYCLAFKGKTSPSGRECRAEGIWGMSHQFIYFTLVTLEAWDMVPVCTTL
jgi:hypothetical protein